MQFVGNNILEMPTKRIFSYSLEHMKRQSDGGGEGGAAAVPAVGLASGTQFTCFASTQVQILTQRLAGYACSFHSVTRDVQGLGDKKK